MLDEGLAYAVQVSKQLYYSYFMQAGETRGGTAQVKIIFTVYQYFARIL